MQLFEIFMTFQKLMFENQSKRKCAQEAAIFPLSQGQFQLIISKFNQTLKESQSQTNDLHSTITLKCSLVWVFLRTIGNDAGEGGEIYFIMNS